MLNEEMHDIDGVPFVEFQAPYISGVIGFLGVVFNVINAAVFISLGLSDTTNISLLGLAVADLGVSLTMFGYGVIRHPFVLEAAPHMDIIDAINYLVLGATHIMFSRIAGCLTALVTAERFLCVSVPLRVKTIITRKRISLAVVGIYVIIVVSTAPTFVAIQIGPRFNPRLNLTTEGLILSWNSDQLEGITLVVFTLAQMTSFLVICVSTLGLIRSLVRQSHWRTTSTKNSTVSSRDKRLVKMVLTIAVVFIACSLPIVIFNLAMLTVKDFSVKGSLRKTFLLTSSVSFIVDAINSTVNIFIYWAMSSKFRHRVFSKLGQTNAVCFTCLDDHAE